MIPIRLIQAGLGGSKVNLDGEAISNDVADPAVSRAQVRFNTDGTIDKLTGNTPDVIQIDASTDWIRPNSAAGGASWEIRFVTTPTDAFDIQSAVKDTWIDISSNRTWGYQQVGIGTKTSGNITFEIRIVGSNITFDTGVYTFDAQVTT